MSSIKPIMAKHHDYCDRLFAEAEHAASQQDWSACLASLQHFVEAMHLHFRAEEEALFPAFEQITGTTGGPTEVMRQEHVRMRELLATLSTAAEAASDEDFFGAGDTLVVFMEQHNRKEEGILYPMCDDRIPDTAAMAEDLGQRLGVTT